MGRYAVSALMLLLALSCTVSAEPIDPSDIRIIDRDTIRVYHEQPNVRLVGFNSPETRRAACEAERELGAKATRRLRDLVRAGNLDFVYVACSCPSGTEGTFTCNYGRDCGTLKSNGRDVGAIPFVCSAIRCPKAPQPWCTRHRRRRPCSYLCPWHCCGETRRSYPSKTPKSAEKVSMNEHRFTMIVALPQVPQSWPQDCKLGFNSDVFFDRTYLTGARLQLSQMSPS